MANALLLIVALAPLPFGSNRPWAWSLLALATGLLLMLWTWRCWRGGAGQVVAARRVRGPALLFLLVCAYAAVQTVPELPPPIANPYWQLPANLLGVAPYDSISIDPAATATALMRLLTYGGIFWLSLQTFRTVEQADHAMFVVALAAAVYSAYGLLMHFTGAELILWYAKWAHIDSVTGTFPNRNHFATFTGLGLLCALAWFARQLGAAANRRGELIELFLHPRPSYFVVVAAVPICILGLVLSLSRAGLFSTLLACLVFLAGLAVHAGGRRALWVAVLMAFLAISGFYVAIASAGLLERLALLFDPETIEYRFPAYRLMLDAIADYPWLGLGYGAFEDAFKIYRAPPVEVYFDTAHSIYLENAIELGLPAATALWLSIGWLGLSGLRAFRSHRSAWVYGWAAACATLLVGTHAAFDFSLQIPAVAIVYAVILGIGCGQAWTIEERQRRLPAHAAGPRFARDLIHQDERLSGPDRPKAYFDRAT
jgi:O-antigen ligase